MTAVNMFLFFPLFQVSNDLGSGERESSGVKRAGKASRRKKSTVSVRQGSLGAIPKAFTLQELASSSGKETKTAIVFLGIFRLLGTVLSNMQNPRRWAFPNKTNTLSITDFHLLPWNRTFGPSQDIRCSLHSTQATHAVPLCTESVHSSIVVQQEGYDIGRGRGPFQFTWIVTCSPRGPSKGGKVDEYTASLRKLILQHYGKYS